MKKRDVFSELAEGFDSLREHREGKRTLRTTRLVERHLSPYTSDRIITLRERLGYSQPVFARLLHVKPATLKNWEQGKSTPNNEAQTLLRLVERDPEAILMALDQLI